MTKKKAKRYKLNAKEIVKRAALKAEQKARIRQRMANGISRNPADWVGAFRAGGNPQPSVPSPTARIIGGGLPSLGKKR